jgi:hypothetical protein
VSLQQGDLFSGHGFPVERNPLPAKENPAVAWSALDDRGLIAALPEAGVGDCLAIIAEIGRHKSVEAIPALERLCQRFAGFGRERIVPEQAAALDAFVMIGGREAAQAVARLVVGGVVQGPGLRKAVSAAATLGSSLPPEIVIPLLRHDDPDIRADACRCLPMCWPAIFAGDHRDHAGPSR